jgi:putative endonuclease
MYSLYIIRCGDGKLYTGITTDLKRRLREHSGTRGAKFTRGRGPFKILYARAFASRSAATRAECRTKALSREEKFELIAHQATDLVQ